MYINLNYTILVIVNGQFSSSKSEEMGAIHDQETDNCDSESPVNRLSGKSSCMKEHKVLIIGDSHTRNCAANVKTDIRDNFEFQGLVKPGAGTVILVNSANSDIMSLSKIHVLIFCGVVNNVGKNNSTKALQHITDFIKTNNHTNIVLVTVPARYDLMQFSCANSEIKLFHRKLKKVVKVYQHMSC
jgi:hypothetical protein